MVKDRFVVSSSALPAISGVRSPLATASPVLRSPACSLRSPEAASAQDDAIFASLPSLPRPSPPATLLAHNAGVWEGTFVRLEGRPEGEALEIERFASRLVVEHQGGTVDASLTNLDSGNVRSMRFAEPPAEMQISPEGHWSLGPDRIGSWPWVSELCLTAGDHRRRAVVRLEGERLISLVVVIEARPGLSDPPPPAPCACRRSARPRAGCGVRPPIWRCGPDPAGWSWPGSRSRARPATCAVPIPTSACCCRWARARCTEPCWGRARHGIARSVSSPPGIGCCLRGAHGDVGLMLPPG